MCLDRRASRLYRIRAGELVRIFRARENPRAGDCSLHAAMSEALAKPSVQERLNGIGAYSTPMTPDEFKDFVRSETEKFGAIIERSKITADE